MARLFHRFVQRVGLNDIFHTGRLRRRCKTRRRFTDQNQLVDFLFHQIHKFRQIGIFVTPAGNQDNMTRECFQRLD